MGIFSLHCRGDFSYQSIQLLGIDFLKQSSEETNLDLFLWKWGKIYNGILQVIFLLYIFLLQYFWGKNWDFFFLRKRMGEFITGIFELFLTFIITFFIYHLFKFFSHSELNKNYFNNHNFFIIRITKCSLIIFTKFNYLKILK